MASTALSRPLSRAHQRLAAVGRHLSTARHVGDAYVLSGARTPTGAFNGAFAAVPAPQLGAVAIRAAVAKARVPPARIAAVYMGNVLSAGVGQAPARQAAVFAGLPPAVEATTVNKVCASGLKAVTMAAADIQLGRADALVAGGCENMSRVPYYLPRASQQPPFGHQQLRDGLVGDGLWDVYNQVHMGNCAERTADKFAISRQEQDDFAVRTYERAQDAWRNGRFRDEVAPVTVPSKRGDTVVAEDEAYNKLQLDKVPKLKPAFVKDPAGTVTAANSSAFSDGASALVLASEELAREHGQHSRVLARIVTSADAAIDPLDFPIAPAAVVDKLLSQSGLDKADIAVWEFNEAFAAVIKANARLLGLGLDRVNPRGGAIALGHALGSSGSRILVTLLHQLEIGQIGAAVICNGGGGATGIVVQRVGMEQLGR